MGRKIIVVTTYGHDQIIDKIAMSYFDESDYSYSNVNADTYCNMINSLKVEEGTWVYAKIVPENTPLDLETFLPFEFQKVLLKLDDRSIQKVMKKLGSQDLAKVLKDAPQNIAEKIFKNMSDTASQILKDDMAYMGPIRLQDVRESQKKMLSIIRHQLGTGEISLIAEGV